MKEAKRSPKHQNGRSFVPAVVIVAAWLAGTVIFESVSVGDDKATISERDSRIAQLLYTWESRETEFAILQSDIGGFDRISGPLELGAKAADPTEQSVARVPLQTASSKLDNVARSDKIGSSGRQRAVSAKTASARLSGSRSSENASIVRGSARVHPVLGRARTVGFTTTDQGGE